MKRRSWRRREAFVPHLRRRASPAKANAISTTALTPRRAQSAMACRPICAGFGFPLLRAARSGAESEGRTPNTMPDAETIALTTPQIDDLGLERIVNRRGLSISRLPNGAIFSLEHRQDDRRRILINQVQASPIAGGLARLLLRIGGDSPAVLPCIGPEANCRIGAADDRFVWRSEQTGRRLPGRAPARRRRRRLAVAHPSRQSARASIPLRPRLRSGSRPRRRRAS